MMMGSSLSDTKMKKEKKARRRDESEGPGLSFFSPARLPCARESILCRFALSGSEARSWRWLRVAGVGVRLLLRVSGLWSWWSHLAAGWSLVCFAVSCSERSPVSAVRRAPVVSSNTQTIHGSGYVGGVGNLAQWYGSCGVNLWDRWRSGSRRCLLVRHVCSSPLSEISFSSLKLLFYGSHAATRCCEVQRLSVQSSVAISTRSLAVWHLGVLYFVLSARLRCYEVLGKLFLDGVLSLRVDSSGKPKLPGFGSRLNLTHLFARVS
ncbi:hypothetical protein F2Q69_00041983 [Brassica cretica]|uniref:Uncharacterized protein n=1 Tax=Brassica cretica TaxID=69181 RepID=A0A8S9NDG1_BRACR|nr:hypothetical protein F2Q69_00041983 [Brassica cretica]